MLAGFLEVMIALLFNMNKMVIARLARNQGALSGTSGLSAAVSTFTRLGTTGVNKAEIPSSSFP
jgi:hypothetical protein